MVKIGHASIDERGKISGGKAGDQTGREVCIRDWYSKPWNVMLICNDKTLAKKAADYMEAICNDSDFGYDQGQRTTGYYAIVKENGKVSKASPSEFDCSSLVASCYKLAGLNINVNCTTRNLRQALLATGKFTAYTDSNHLSSDKYATIGAVYLKEGSHVVMALENGSAGKEVSRKPKYKVGETYTLKTEMKVRSKAGTENSAKKYKQLAANDKKYDKDKDGALDAGTKVICKAVKEIGSDIWIKTSSGWIAAYYNSKIYIK